MSRYIAHLKWGSCRVIYLWTLSYFPTHSGHRCRRLLLMCRMTVVYTFSVIFKYCVAMILQHCGWQECGWKWEGWETNKSVELKQFETISSLHINIFSCVLSLAALFLRLYSIRNYLLWSCTEVLLYVQVSINDAWAVEYFHRRGL